MRLCHVARLAAHLQHWPPHLLLRWHLRAASQVDFVCIWWDGLPHLLCGKALWLLVWGQLFFWPFLCFTQKHSLWVTVGKVTIILAKWPSSSVLQVSQLEVFLNYFVFQAEIVLPLRVSEENYVFWILCLNIYFIGQLWFCLLMVWAPFFSSSGDICSYWLFKY